MLDEGMVRGLKSDIDFVLPCDECATNAVWRNGRKVVDVRSESSRHPVHRPSGWNHAIGHDSLREDQ